MRGRKRSCHMCENGIRILNYKDEKTVSKFITDRGKILPRRITGACSRHQRQVSTAIKRARFLALIPYVGGYKG